MSFIKFRVKSKHHGRVSRNKATPKKKKSVRRKSAARKQYKKSVKRVKSHQLPYKRLK